MMGLAGRGARSARRTLAGEGVVTILRITSSVNLLKLASTRMVAEPRGLAAGPMEVFESVGIDAHFFPEALALNTCRQYRSVQSRPYAARPQAFGKASPAFNSNRRQAVLLCQRSVCLRLLADAVARPDGPVVTLGLLGALMQLVDQITYCGVQKLSP